MKTTRTAAGIYTVTGHTAAGDLVQYEVAGSGKAWSVTLVYGKGRTLSSTYTSKAAALQAIKEAA